MREPYLFTIGPRHPQGISHAVASLCRFLIANEFLCNVDTAPLVFPADMLTGAAAKLPPMQHILDVDVSDEEPEGGAASTAGAVVGAVPGAAAEEPQNGMAATEVGHDGDVVDEAAAETMEGAAAVADKDSQEPVMSTGDPIAPADPVATATENPEEIVLAE